MNATSLRSTTIVSLQTAPSIGRLLDDVRRCRACEAELPLGPRPVVQASESARILVVGQAPGLRVHRSGIPWDDASGERLRDWTGLSGATFYDASKVAILPMGFCYPGRGKGGDLPPRPECAQLWTRQLLALMPNIELTLLIGLYAQRYFLGPRRKTSLTATVEAWREYAPTLFPLPHPSPRNTPWLRRNDWFEKNLLSELKRCVGSLNLSGAPP